MDATELLKEFKNKKVLLFPKTKLDELLNLVEILVEKDTLVNGMVRVLKLKETFLFQETTGKDELALRKFTQLKDAEKVVNDRLEIYENMWNGCGCKVNYYE